MKKIIFAFFMVFILAFSAQADTIRFAWDANDPLPDGYRMFMRVNDGSYDYMNPIVFDIIQSSNIPPEYIEIDYDGAIGIPGELTTYYFVIRAFVGNDESVDSNEVDYVINMTNPVPANSLEGSFDKTNSTVTLGWLQEQDNDRVKYWIVYFSETSGGPYIELDVVNNDGSNNPTVTSALTAVEEGQIKTIYFVVVSFSDENIYSVNSEELPILIDRRIPIPPNNFRKVITIPVQ